MKDKLFLIGSILTIVSGVILLTFTLFGNDDNTPVVILGLVLLFLGFIVAITGYTTPSVAQSKEGVSLAYLMIFASILVVLWIVSVVGGVLLAISSLIIWPCFCCQGKTKNRDKVIGVASAHDSITVNEISKRTSLTANVVRDLLYDALGKGDIVGKMEGETFIRGRPTTTTYAKPSTTTTREVVKVLVICPYCGAKTEQGLTKCQNCKADL